MKIFVTNSSALIGRQPDVPSHETLFLPPPSSSSPLSLRALPSPFSKLSPLSDRDLPFPSPSLTSPPSFPVGECLSTIAAIVTVRTITVRASDAVRERACAQSKTPGSRACAKNGNAFQWFAFHAATRPVPTGFQALAGRVGTPTCRYD